MIACSILFSLHLPILTDENVATEWQGDSNNICNTDIVTGEERNLACTALDMNQRQCLYAFSGEARCGGAKDEDTSFCSWITLPLFY